MPAFALILAVTGALAVCVEFCAPGRVLPGVAGATLMILGLNSLSRQADWRVAVVAICGIALLAIGAKVRARGTLAAAGALALVFSATMLHISPYVALALLVPFSAIVSVLLSIALRARRNKLLSP
jgi:membrane-bound ClpP family serine protease